MYKPPNFLTSCMECGKQIRMSPSICMTYTRHRIQHPGVKFGTTRNRSNWTNLRLLLYNFRKKSTMFALLSDSLMNDPDVCTPPTNINLMLEDPIDISMDQTDIGSPNYSTERPQLEAIESLKVLCGKYGVDTTKPIHRFNSKNETQTNLMLENSIKLLHHLRQLPGKGKKLLRILVEGFVKLDKRFALTQNTRCSLNMF